MILDAPTPTIPPTTDEPHASAEAAPPSLHTDLVTERFLRLIPRDFARQHLIISQGMTPDGGECLVHEQWTDAAAVYNTGVRLGCRIESRRTEHGQGIAETIDAAYGRVVDDAHGDLDQVGSASPDDLDDLLAEADKDLLATAGKAPLIKLVDGLLFEALGRSASDVHVQPLSDRTLVRYRLDGVLHMVRELPGRLTQPLVSRIKVMGRMDIAERRVPQDGRATVTIGDRSIDLRISTLPTSHGERAVIRLLDNTHQLGSVAQLGMPPAVAGRYLACARRSHGIILVTGPTGSGKTTTLYATLGEVAGGGGGGLNIMTIEDPIEYELSTVGGLAVSQSQVNTKKGVTFANGLRHILRQDPDVVMVGEIRDGETARTAIQASLTGHLVLSTLHTNDAPSAVTRLVDLGVEPYLVSASLSAVLAQRLVRLTHDGCGGAGCPDCLSTGYRGRCGLFELMVVDEALRARISRNAELIELRQAARAGGLCTLREEGERLVREGRTTPAEVERVTGGAG